MKKVLNSKLFIFIITAIVFTGIGAGAATQITAADIKYVTNVSVKDKLDDLYTTQSTIVTNLQSANSTLTTDNETLTSENQTLTTNYNNLNNQYNSLLSDYTDNLSGTNIYTNSVYTGNRQTSNPISVELPAGKYICNVTLIAAAHNNDYNTYSSNPTAFSEPEITGCNITTNQTIKKRQTGIDIITGTTNPSRYNVVNIVSSNFICDTNDATTLTATFTSNNISGNPIGREIICNKIK